MKKKKFKAKGKINGFNNYLYRTKDERKIVTGQNLFHIVDDKKLYSVVFGRFKNDRLNGIDLCIKL